MATPVQQYTHDIRSICEVHPELPNVIEPFNLDVRINAGDPIDQHLLIHAQAIATWLGAVLSKTSQNSLLCLLTSL
jgi:hypothetical protein